MEAVKTMSLVAKRFGGKVKAAGGIRSFSDAVAMIEAGAYPNIIESWILNIHGSIRNK